MSSMEAVAIKSLADFGYGFNDEGKLRQLDPKTGELTDKPFNFEVSDTHAKNQKHYEELGAVIDEHVYKLLDDHGLHRIPVPADQPEPKASFVFSTQKELKDVDKLMVIIHGSGVVLAGQWSRRLVINHSLDAGTCLPYIKEAQKEGFEVIITNTNDNKRDGKYIKGSGSPEEHANAVWEQIVQPSNAKSIAVVAHSYGGHVAVVLGKNFKEDFNKRVFAVALTDSVHGSLINPRLAKIGINFVSSSAPLGTPEDRIRGGIPRVSAGHPKHEMTSYSCQRALFEFIKKRYQEERGDGVEDASTENLKDDSPEAKKSKTDEL